MDIREEILTFINRKEETGALLITGKWGSGKSYYIKDLAKELNDNKKEYLCVISLFGIDSVASLIKAVKECYLEANSTVFTKTARKIGKIVGKTVDSGLKVAEAATGGNVAVSAAQKGFSSVLSLGLLDFISVKNYIGRGKSKRKFVLVFDDLERCKINMIDLLGAINEYCENRNIKTIILADENKILANEVSLKKVNWKEDEKEKEISITEQQKSADNYSEFKEKVIFQKIGFEASIDIIDKMIDRYTESVEGYKDFIKDNADIIKQAFAESESDNLRFIKKIITNFERVYSAIKKTEVSDDFALKILYGFAIKSFEARPKIQQNEENSNINKILIRHIKKEKNTKQSTAIYNGEYINIYSLQQWMDTGRYDEEAVISELKNFFTPKHITDKFKVLHWSIFDIDAQTTTNGLNDALNDAYNGLLEAEDYVGLIDRLQYYKEYKLPFDEIDYTKLSEGIDKYIERFKNGEITDKLRFHVSSDIMKRANNNTRLLLEKLEYIEYNYAYWILRNNFIDSLKNNEGMRYTIDVHGLEELDDTLLDIFEEAYQKADNSKKRELGHVILSINYTVDAQPVGSENNYAIGKKIDVISNTIKNFKKLNSFIVAQSEEEEDIITKMILNQFSSNIKDKVQQIEDYLVKLKETKKDKR